MQARQKRDVCHRPRRIGDQEVTVRDRDGNSKTLKIDANAVSIIEALEEPSATADQLQLKDRMLNKIKKMTRAV